MQVVYLFMLSLILTNAFPSHHQEESKEVSVILEVEDDVKEHVAYIEKHMPRLEVVATYELLFQGVAVKGNLDAVKRVTNLDFIKESYPVQTYTTLEVSDQKYKNQTIQNLDDITDRRSFVLPSELNDTNFTGKGIKVGVIDTGLDYEHADLRANFFGGFDLVDLDDDPMETKDELPTAHGTHVAGIIAADGALQGVAPDAEIYAYRALGPGGSGTSIQVMAAMEEAVRDGVDVINLSLGNTVNGPDYPTSKTVNEAAKQGVAVVVANGNAGPKNWTVGSPATAARALSVGAYEAETDVPHLHIAVKDKKIALQSLSSEAPWQFERDYDVVLHEKSARGEFALMEVQAETIVDDVLMLKERGVEGVIIYEEKSSEVDWQIALMEAEINLPIAAVSRKDGRWLKRHSESEEFLFADTVFKTKQDGVARFSSRGPVTVDWTVKPDIIAPGVNILSTVPDGYETMNGTSMATPHIAGAVAVMKEAKPNWSNEQIFNALKTTAQRVERIDGKMAAPIDQGFGLVQLSDAIDADLIVHGAPFTFGLVGDYLHESGQQLTIENTSSEVKNLTFKVPKMAKGLIWDLPQSITIEPNEEKEIPIKLHTNSLLLDEGIIQDWITIEEKDKEINVPYVFINETSNYKKVMGFSFGLNRFDDTTYNYELYVPEPVTNVKVKLFDAESLLYKGTLLELTELEVGMNKGEIDKEQIDVTGKFYGLIIVELENGETVHYDTPVYLE